MSATASLSATAQVRRSLLGYIQSTIDEDPLMVGASGYLDDVFTTRLVSDTE
jgi:hypothetical protein